MTNPERHVIDAIDELVEWQIREGLRRGDGRMHGRDGPPEDPVAAMLRTLSPEQLAEVVALVNKTMSNRASGRPTRPFGRTDAR